jgi:hypothetical protein
MTAAVHKNKLCDSHAPLVARAIASGWTRTQSGPLSAGRWLASENRQLSVESTLEGGPRFAAGDIGGEVPIFVQHTRCFQPEQHRDHHQVARAECTIEPVGIAKATREFAQPVTDAILDDTGRRCAYQALSPSRNLVVMRSRIGGSTVLSAANIYVIARARGILIQSACVRTAP